jgi:hypothetical protein
MNKVGHNNVSTPELFVDAHIDTQTAGVLINLVSTTEKVRQYLTHI